METRALAIAFFYAIGTAVGGITGPLLFGNLINSGKLSEVATGFFIGAAVMAIGGIAELLFGVRAEQRSLEDVAAPLSEADGTGDASEPGAAGESPRRRRPPARALRPGPGPVRWYPGMSMPAQVPTVGHEREIESIVTVLRARGGATPRADLERLVGARRWGPGRFGAAVGAAVREGRIQRSGRSGYRAPPLAHAARRDGDEATAPPTVGHA
jgi:hypothetical protein